MTQPADIWAVPLPNPLYDKTVTDPSDIRSHQTYKASEYLVGDWRSDIQAQQLIAAQSAALTALSTAVAAQHGMTAADVQAAVATAIQQNEVRVIVQGVPASTEGPQS